MRPSRTGFTQLRGRSRAFYERIAPWVVLATLVLTMIGVWIGVASIATDNRQDVAAAAANKVRDTQNRDLLDCFDDFASALSAGLPVVRDASAKRDEMTQVRDDAVQEFAGAFENLLVMITTGEADGIEDLQPVTEALADLRRASRQLDRASAELEVAREENPYPPPPSKFCAIESR